MSKSKVKPVCLVYFDLETSTYGEGIEEEVRPYLTGWTSSIDLRFYWSRKIEDFIEYLEELNQTHSIKLWAHNTQYDIKILYKLYLAKRKHTIKWAVSTEDESFISFKFFSDKLIFVACDTWIWNKGYSLEKYCIELGIEQKGSLAHYKKKNCVDNGTYLCFLDKDNKPQKTLITEEVEYLRKDVMSLPAIVNQIYAIKDTVKKLLNIPLNAKQADKKTSSGFAKWIINYLLGGQFDELFRPFVDSSETYNEQQKSSCGGFTSYDKKQLSVCL